MIKDQFAVQFNSYFESEGDQDIELRAALLEDEIWTMIRLEPDALPTGNVKVIPGSMYQRLSHTDFKVETAKAELKQVDGQEGLMAYSLEYSESNRSLTIHFNKDFPHEIEGWEERSMSGFWKQRNRIDNPGNNEKKN